MLNFKIVEIGFSGSQIGNRWTINSSVEKAYFVFSRANRAGTGWLNYYSVLQEKACVFYLNRFTDILLMPGSPLWSPAAPCKKDAGAITLK